MDEETTTTTETTSGDSTTTSESAPDFSEPVAPPEAPSGPEVVDQPSTQSDPVGTTRLAIDAADMLVGGVFGPPPPEFDSAPISGLTEAEREALGEALLPVVKKYDVPDVPWAEETRLAIVAGSIVYRRVRYRRLQRDSSFARKKGKRQVDALAEAGLPEAGAVDVRDILG